MISFRIETNLRYFIVPFIPFLCSVGFVFIYPNTFRKAGSSLKVDQETKDIRKQSPTKLMIGLLF